MALSENDIKDIILDNQFLGNQNANHDAYIQDLADFILPRRAWVTSIRTKGERLKFNFLYDSTAIRALRDAASNFHTNLNDQTSRWFGFETAKKNLMKSLRVRSYWKDVEDVMFTILNDSNYYNVIQEFYTDFIGFSPGTFSMLEDDQDFVRFQLIPVKEVRRVVDARGRLSELYRNYRLTARQAVKLWGSDAGKSVLEAVEKKPFSEFDFLHYVGPRHVRDVSKQDALNMNFQSVWIAIKDKHLLKESGFRELPYMSEVFYADGEDPNGFGAAMDVFPDIKLVNAMKRTMIRSDMKDMDPPYIMPSRGFTLPLNLNPGAINYRDSKTNADDIELLPRPKGSGRSNSKDSMLSVQDDIRDGFFIPLFRSLSGVNKQMTIPEVQQRISENMKILGPVVGRVLHGIHDPTLIRLYKMGNRKGIFPEPPPELQDQEFSPIYLSALAKAQKQSELANIQLYLNDLNLVGQVKPNIYDNINEDKLANVMARMRSVTPEIQNEQEVMDRMRAHREEQNQLIAALQAGESLSKSAKAGAAANKDLSEAA